MSGRKPPGRSYWDDHAIHPALIIAWEVLCVIVMVASVVAYVVFRSWQPSIAHTAVSVTIGAAIALVVSAAPWRTIVKWLSK
jgi:hypothetical protein